MKLFSSFFNWYFGRNALPYWCIVIFDFLLCFFGAAFVMWLRHPLTELLPHASDLTHTLLVFGVANLLGYRMFHTYSGILRYSQFVDLLRVLYATIFSMVLALLFNYSVLRFGWTDIFYALTGRKIVIIYIFTGALMGFTRVLIRLIFENVLVSKNAQNVLIYGTHAGAIAMTNEARSNKPVRFLIEGYIGDSKPHYKERLMGKRIYSTQEDLLEVIQSKNIKAVLVSPLKHEMFLHNRKLQDLFINAGVRIYIAQNAEQWNKKKDYKEKVLLREVKIEDLLPREEIQVDMEKVGALLRGKKVLITGSAGSIGSEMVRQIAMYKPSDMMLIDQAETPQHDIRLMMMSKFPDIPAETVVTSICKLDRMEKIFSTFRPDYVFHAAAYKHVPMMEDNPSESIQNNVYGTKVIADLSVKYGV